MRTTVEGCEGQVQLLGYLDFDRHTRRSSRYTPEGEIIDQCEPWHQDFDQWLREYQEYWSLNPSDAYFPADPDLAMDEGL